MTFTASQFAASLGITPQAVRQQLHGVDPAASKVVSGNKETAAWTIEQLPPKMLARLNKAASEQRCRSVEALLANPRRRYHPPMALDRISDADITAATKLREALRHSLLHQHDPNLAADEMDARGVEDYRRVFGTVITARYWRELFARTVRRDNGFEEWNRMEIYLSEQPKPKATPADVVSEALAEDFAELEQFISACGNPHAPNKTERAGVWTLALEKLASLVRNGMPEKSAARLARCSLDRLETQAGHAQECQW
jgi:hypothetical protein